MKTLLTTPITTYNEGQPLKQGSVNHITNSYSEMAVALATAFVYNDSNLTLPGTTPVALYDFGPHVSGGNMVFQDTWILYEGKLYHSPAINLPYPLVGGNDYVGTITTSYVTSAIADPVLMSDGITTANVHQDQVIVWSVATTGSGNFSYLTVEGTQQTWFNFQEFQGLALSDINTLNTKVAVGAWASCTMATGWTPDTGGVQCNIDGMGRVFLRGFVTAGAGATTHICTLPSAAYYPLYPFSKPCVTGVSDTETMLGMQVWDVTESGDIYFSNETYTITTGMNVDLSGVSPWMTT